MNLTAIPTYTIMPDYGMSPYAWLQRPPSGRHHGVGGICADSTGWRGEHPISDSLHRDFMAWVRTFDAAPRKYDGSPDLDWSAFHARGIALALRLKTKLRAAALVVYEKPQEDPDHRRDERREVAADGSLVPLPGRAEIFHAGVTSLVRKVVSGGQTGVDRAALDWAISAGIAHGGWCPRGRKSEDGPIPGQYLMSVMATGGYRQRTRRNVAESDGTLVLNLGKLDGGTRLTLDFAMQLDKPYLLLDMELFNLQTLALQALRWLRQQPIAVLNIAGPRESKRPGVRWNARRLLDDMLNAPASAAGKGYDGKARGPTGSQPYPAITSRRVFVIDDA